MLESACGDDDDGRPLPASVHFYTFLSARLHHYFKLEDVKALCEAENEIISSQEAAAILGLTSCQVQKMAAKGEIRPVRGPNIDGFAKRLYLRSYIEKLAAERLGAG